MAQLRRALELAFRLAATPPVQAPAPRPVRTGAPRRVLLADDNRINQRVFSRILEGAGHAVVIAQSGDEALDVLEDRADELDIVSMDFNMPDTDGLEATKLYRMMATGGRRLPIVGLTADATGSDRQPLARCRHGRLPYQARGARAPPFDSGAACPRAAGARRRAGAAADRGAA